MRGKTKLTTGWADGNERNISKLGKKGGKKIKRTNIR